jgi:hypothetical protein
MRNQSKLAVCAALLAAPAALALPSAVGSPQSAVPSTLSANDVVADGRAITLTLPNGGTYVVNGVRNHPASGMTSLSARASDGAARLYAFVANGALVSANAYGSFWHYELQQSGGQEIWALPRADLLGADELDRRTQGLPHVFGVAPTAAPDADGIYEIRVLVLYTPKAAQRLGSGNVETKAQQLIGLASGIMETSKVPVRYVLAGVAPFFDTSEDRDYYQNMDDLAGSDSARVARDAAEADLILLIRSMDGNPMGHGGSTLCGLSSGFNNFDQGDPPQNVDSERDAFTIAGMAPGDFGTCADFVAVHEIGHSLAGGHDYLVTQGGQNNLYWKPYSHAQVCVGLAAPTTILSLMWGSSYPGIDHGDVISNPDLLLGGEVCGSNGVQGVEATQANNAKAMTEAAPYVAAYRGAAQSSGGGGDSGGASGDSSGGALSLGALLVLLGGALRRTRTEPA